MFPKRQTQRKLTAHVSRTQNHAHTQAQHTHTHHAHNAHHAHNVHHAHHVFMYAKVYSCTYCGRKGHLAKFYYDKLNVSNNHAWVQKTNILGPKKIWVSKLASLLNDISMRQGLKT